MIDLNLIEKGQPYSSLNKTIIIFICREDVFGKDRHIYTFENICKEDPTIRFGDETTKVFLYTDATIDDVGTELKDFLDYVGGRDPQSEYAKELDEAVKKARANVEWRREFMTLLMRDMENRRIGKVEGKAEGKAEDILELLYDLGDVPRLTVERIFAESDLAVLGEWLKTAAKANSIDDFVTRSGL
jgi:predicted transposase/invertase (TIGR01784 family)